MAERANKPLLLQVRMPPRRVGCGRNEENHGGHDCNFVEPPPEAFQTDCPICLLILKEPCLMNGCEFVAVECTHKCGERFQHRHIATHQNEQCMERPYACEYCRYYTSTFKGVTEIHYA